jgi:RNA polymerase sigma factor (sigma-70 family)
MAELRSFFGRRSPHSPGRRAELEALFRQENQTLLRFLRARLPADADPAEAAQEAYVRVLQLQSSEPTFLRAYLFRTAENVARDIRRRRNTRLRAGELMDGLENREEVEAPEVNQEGRLAAAQQLAIAEKALQELPPRCRQAVLLRRRDGWAVGRIAEHLGVSPRMVHLYLERAIEHLQAALNSEPIGARR